MKAWADPLYDNSGWSRIIKSVDFYFRPGLTWPSRTNGLSFRALPKGCIFGHKGSAAFVGTDNQKPLQALAGILNSQAFGYLISIQLARTSLAQSFEVGLIQQTPIPKFLLLSKSVLADSAEQACTLKRNLGNAREISHAFHLPSLLRVEGHTLSKRITAWQVHINEARQKLADLQRQIDEIAFQLYGIEGKDRQAIEESVSVQLAEDTVSIEDME